MGLLIGNLNYLVMVGGIPSIHLFCTIFSLTVLCQSDGVLHLKNFNK